jgi:malate dehydrogenase (oxaloacetate-decarboxylating)
MNQREPIMIYCKKTDKNNQDYLEVSLTEKALITNPLLNKGMAFSKEEREAFHLLGYIPPHFATLVEQQERSYEAFSSKKSDIEKYLYLRDLQDSNETLFYSLLVNHITEMLPIVYTPVVGEACQRFSETYRRPRGVFIAYPYKDQIDEILSSSRFDDVEAIVVSDGERILGLGDQGAGGMGIPIGKLTLYSACAGLHPSTTLPILLDTGTNNQDRINNPLYIGWRHERIRGQEYDDFIEAFVTAVKKRFPHVLLQWEDFAQQNANPILEKYRDQLCTFNDDIQGTAAIATGTILSSLPVTGTPLRDHRIAVFGGGSAGCGISNLLMAAMVHDGLSEAEARSRFFLVDRNGLLIEGTQGLMAFQEPFCQSKEVVSDWNCLNNNNITLLDVIKNCKPTILIGVSGQGGAFTEEIIREMAAHVNRPVICPLSNPTSRSEATPEDLIKWTNNKAVIGTGSPFPPVMRDGVLTRIDQTNNAYIFPGMGLGLIAVRATRVTDKMFMVAARALAACSPTLRDPKANLLPPLSDIRAISLQVGLAVAREAVASGLAPVQTEEQIEQAVRNKVWEPAYLPYKKA